MDLNLGPSRYKSLMLPNALIEAGINVGCCLQTVYLSRPAPPPVKARKGQKHYRGSKAESPDRAKEY